MATLGHPSKFQRVSRLGSVTARHSGSRRQPNFAALNRGRQLYSSGWPSRWAVRICRHSSCIYLLPAALRAAQACRYLIYSEADFEVFSPRRGDTLHRWGETWHGGGDLHAKFHPQRCNDKGVGPQKLKFLLRSDRNMEYKRPAGAYPLRDFHKICRVCTPFQVR